MAYEVNPLYKEGLQKKSAVQPGDIDHLQDEIDTLTEDIRKKVPKIFTSIEELEIGEIGEYQGETNETFTNGYFYKRGAGVNEFRYEIDGNVTLLRRFKTTNIYHTQLNGECPKIDVVNPNRFICFQAHNVIEGHSLQFYVLPETYGVVSPYYVDNDSKFNNGANITKGYLMPFAYTFGYLDSYTLPIRYENQVLEVQYHDSWYEIQEFQAVGLATSPDSIYTAFLMQDGKLCPAWFYVLPDSSVSMYGCANNTKYYAIDDYCSVVENLSEYLSYWNMVDISEILYIPTYINIPAITRVDTQPSLNPADFATAAQGAKADSALQSIAKGTDGNYITTTVSAKSDNSQTVSSSLTLQPLATADADHKGIPESSDLKTYISTAAATAAQGAKADSALQGVVHGTDGLYVTTSVTAKDANNEQAIHTALSLQDIATADADHKGVAEASDIRHYLDILNSTSEAYGVMWDTENPSPDLTRIGNMQNHALLPVQSAMIGGVMADDGTFTPFDNQSDWTQATQARDGSDGQVMVRLPHHWRKSSMVGTYRVEMMSPVAIPGYVEVREQYVSAYEASLQHSTNKLSSVNNATADYRGGQNESSWDGTYRTLLNRPISNLDLSEFRTYARNRGNGTKWNCLTYEAVRTIYWLFVIEYATLNSQADYNAALDANGYHQGGLGMGVSDWTGDAWNDYNGYAPLIPCGVLDQYGNGTAIKNYSIYNADSTLAHTFSCNKYRGIEMPFGHLWKHTDGVLINVESGDGISTAYVAVDPANFSSTSVADYAAITNTIRVDSYIKGICFGANGDMFAIAGDANSTSYFCDQYWGANLPSSGSSLRAWVFGGNAHSGAQAGLACAYSNSVPGRRARNIGSRLCFVP